jgi:6-phosphogluconate dehydrogenase
VWHLTIGTQSVFLGDITAAYDKNPKLESLLFDDFFKKGEILFIFLSQRSLPSHDSRS